MKITIRTILSLMFVFTISMTIHSQSKKIETLKSDYIESVLLEINDEKYSLKKWENKDTLKYYIDGDFRYMSNKKWKSYIGDIENLIDITIIETENIDESDINIVFGELDQYLTKYNIKVGRKELIKEFDNWHSRKYNSKKQITNASFCIVPSNTKDSKRGRFNLKNQFLKSLGLLGELNNEYSLLNKYQTNYNSHLSKNDRRIIKMHYDNFIKAGMTVEDIKIAFELIDISTIINEK